MIVMARAPLPEQEMVEEVPETVAEVEEEKEVSYHPLRESAPIPVLVEHIHVQEPLPCNCEPT